MAFGGFLVLQNKTIMTLLVAAQGVWAGSIFITSRDAGGGDLYQYTQAGALIQTLPGNGLVNGQGVVVGPNGNIFVVNEAGSVLQYNPTTGAFINKFATTAAYPGPLAFGADGKLYVGVGNQVQQFNGTTGALIGTFASGHSLSSVSGMVFDGSGNLFVSDGVNGIVDKFDSTGAFVSTFVSGQAALVNGVGGLIFNGSTLLVAATFGNGGPTWGNQILAFDTAGTLLGNFASGANLNGPDAMAFGPDGYLYVLNYAGGNVVRYTSAGAFVDTFIASGPGGMRGIAFVNDAPAGPGPSGVPEPGTVALVGVGLAALLLRKRA
jgi:hypothetical protein